MVFSKWTLCLERKRACDLAALGNKINVQNLDVLIRKFLFEQFNPHDDCDPQLVSQAEYPCFDGHIYTFNSVSSRFYAQSDICEIQGMQWEYIRSTPNWRREGPRWDCVFIGTNTREVHETCLQNCDVARILAFLSFNYNGTVYPCAVIRWFDRLVMRQTRTRACG